MAFSLVKLDFLYYFNITVLALPAAWLNRWQHWSVSPTLWFFTEIS